MPTLIEQLETLRGEHGRTTAELTTLREQFSAIPGGAAGLPALLQSATEVTRLTGELSTAREQLTAANADVTRLTTDLEAARQAKPGAEVTEAAENRAAEIVATTGTTPATPDSAAAGQSGAGEPANFESFTAEYRRLHTESPVKGGAYYALWSKKFGM